MNGELNAYIVPPLIKTRARACHVARRVRAPTVWHLAQHVLGDGLEARVQSVVPFDVAPGWPVSQVDSEDTLASLSKALCCGWAPSGRISPRGKLVTPTGKWLPGAP